MTYPSFARAPARVFSFEQLAGDLLTFQHCPAVIHPSVSHGHRLAYLFPADAQGGVDKLKYFMIGDDIIYPRLVKPPLLRAMIVHFRHCAC